MVCYTLEVEVGIGKDGGIRLKGDNGAVEWRLTNFFNRTFSYTSTVFLGINFAVSVYLGPTIDREGVDYRTADAMKSS